jgi:hypothetical protein
LIEVVVTVVIMGLIIAPLTTALFEAMRLVPASGDRTRLATDSELVATKLSDDVASGQQIYNVVASGSPVFSEPSSGPWTQLDSGPTITTCVNSAADVPAFGIIGGSFLWVFWTDSGIGGSPSQRIIEWAARITGSGARRLVEIRRVDNAGNDNVLLTGYCQASPAAENVVTIQTFKPVAGTFNEHVLLTIQLRDSIGNLEQPLKLDAEVRASCGGDIGVCS